MGIRLARFLLRLGKFVQSLAVVVMTPDDLIEFSRQSYARPQDVESWSEDGLVNSGLRADELELLSAVPARAGELLLLGVGGGREGIAFARLGFHVTGVDFIPAMVEGARENAARHGLRIDGIVQEISRLDVPPAAYDVVWLSWAMYSSVPTRRRRVEMVRRIARALKPGGMFVCQFQWNAQGRREGRGEFARRVVGACIGKRDYEAGDTLWAHIEFVHEFTSVDAIRSELEDGGLCVVRLQTDLAPLRGGAICTKTLSDILATPT